MKNRKEPAPDSSRTDTLSIEWDEIMDLGEGGIKPPPAGFKNLKQLAREYGISLPTAKRRVDIAIADGRLLAGKYHAPGERAPMTYYAPKR